MVDENRRVTTTSNFNGVELVNSMPDNVFLSKPVAESITDAMNNAPMGAMAEIVYASLAARLKCLLDPSGLLGLMASSFVHTAVQFRAVNPGFRAPGAPVPSVMANQGPGGRYARIWGPHRDERLPHTVPLSTEEVPYAMGQDPGELPNQGLVVEKLFADLQNHLPVVMFNITSKNNVPMAIGGSAVTGQYWHNGKTVTQLGYRVILTVEATLVTNDDESAANLQAIVEAAFGTLRDQVSSGALISGRSWELTLPTKLSPSSIAEVDAPWSAGDDKGAKLYTSTIGLEDMTFECVMYVSRPVNLRLSQDLESAGAYGAVNITVPGENTATTEPLRLKLGAVSKLIVNGMNLTTDVAVSQNKRVVELRKPNQGSGTYEIVARRTGEAVLRLYDTGMTVNSQSTNPLPSVTGEPLFERKVIVTAV
jgi:hypothetical protein